MYVYNKVLELTYGGDTPIYSSGNLQWQVLSHVTIHILADVGEWVFPLLYNMTINIRFNYSKV